MKSSSFPHNLGRAEKAAVFTLMGAAAVIVFGSLFGFIVQSLWNATLVPLAGAGEISFWQAIGVLILAKLFFGFGTGSGPKTPKYKKKRAEQVAQEDEDLLKQDAFRKYWDREGRQAYEAFKTSQEDQSGDDKP